MAHKTIPTLAEVNVNDSRQQKMRSSVGDKWKGQMKMMMMRETATVKLNAIIKGCYTDVTVFDDSRSHLCSTPRPFLF